MYNKIFKYTIEKAFINVIKKHKISGSITSLTESPKTVIAYDRKNGLLIASTMRELSDGSFEIFLPYREDGQLTLICRDEGGDYNADIYDRLSLCTVEYAPPEGSNLIFRELKTALLEEYEEAAYTNGFMTIPFISAHENIKGAIAKAITSPLEFKDSGNATITNSDVSDSAEMNGSSFIINYDDSLILRNSKVGATLVHDFFGDGSAKVTIPFNKNNEDLSGNGCSVSNAIRYTSSPSGGFGAKIFTTDITSRRPVNRFNSYDRTKPYTLSFWMLLTSNSPDTTHLVMMEGAFYVKVHNNQSIYFATAASATTWNAETFVSLSTPGLLYTWRHITISFNNGYFKLYLDGVEKTNQTRTNITSTSSTGFLEFTRLEINNVNISFSMFRIFDKILTQTEVNAIYAERLGNVINSVNTIYGTNFDKKRLALNGTGLIGNAFINLPFDGSIADKSGTGIVSTTTGLEIQDDFIKLDGSVTLHRALTCADTSNGFTHGDENNVEVLCKIQPTSVGSDMVIWKSGNSTNGLGVGIKSGNIGIFANNASVQTSISIPVSNIIIGQWYKLLCKADEIVLLNESGQIVTRQAGSFSSGLALSQESIGGACNGSPLTPGSTGALEYFNGRIYDITTYEKGTSKILTTGQLKLAAEFGSTGIECDIEIEKWDAANNECILWVNIPSLSSTEDNILRLYFQKDHADNSSKITITNAEPETPVGVSQDFIDLKLAAKNDTIASYEEFTAGLVPALQTWEYAKKALVTIPAENIPSDMTNFKFPIKLKTSSGTTGYNFNTWFTEMMYSSYIDGNKIKDYKFGSKKHSLAGFNTSNIVYSMDRDLNINGSLKFDGSSNRIVNLKNVRRSYFSGDMSFSVWLKFGPEHLTTTYRSVLGTIGWQELSIYTYNGSIYIVFGDGVSVSYKTTIQIDLKMVIGGWVHLVLALDTKVATKQYYVYVDGVLYSTAGYTYGGGYGANDFLIGSNADYPTNRFIGEIDAFMVFSKTLTQDDVTKLYNGSSLKSYTNRYVTSTFSINENVFHPLKGNPLSNIEIISNKKNQALSASIEFETGKFYIATIVGWRIIASNLESIHGHVGNTNWFYRTSENTWVESGIDKNKAISYACSFPENRMDLDYVKTITQEKFSEIFNQSTGMANIAISMISNSVSAVPEVTKIIYNKKEYWLSKEYDLTDYNGNIVSSDVRWDINTIENIDQNAFLKVFVMITGDTTWTQCTSASPIPGITAGMTTTGKKMKFKVEWDKTINGSLEINKTLLRFKIK